MATYPDSADTLHAGELEIRPAEGLVLAGGEVIMLSARELEMLCALARRSGTVITREHLYATVWGGALRPGDRSVDVYVSKLRTKLEREMPGRRFIHTHQGFGYRFQPEPTRGAVRAASQAPSGSAGGGAERPSRNLHTGAAPPRPDSSRG